ncbi:FHA domain-containing protein [Okeania sp. SIO3I5]|uniref:FHA domain-containing protein n=1 Tax=Okeania sp. SIO3I5 TaxID=2607805 RepID=UPI0025F758E0|nr:FHA domain-containing protein [Okeania sp. SIO3I5]
MRLILLHPLQSMPIRSWTFDHQPVIKIGRCSDNDVVLYSSVVSRYHVELKSSHGNWEILNLGSNGTYIDGKPITKVKAVNGLIINLALSGPKIAIYLQEESQGVNFKERQNYYLQNSLKKLETRPLKPKFNLESKQQELVEDTKAE